MTVAGAYTLHLYCECCGKFAEYTGDFHQGPRPVLKRAMLDGWKINGNKTVAWCPKHDQASPRPDTRHSEICTCYVCRPDLYAA